MLPETDAFEIKPVAYLRQVDPNGQVLHSADCPRSALPVETPFPAGDHASFACTILLLAVLDGAVLTTSNNRTVRDGLVNCDSGCGIGPPTQMLPFHVPACTIPEIHGI